jgi:hypothetical protein
MRLYLKSPSTYLLGTEENTALKLAFQKSHSNELNTEQRELNTHSLIYSLIKSFIHVLFIGLYLRQLH